MSAPSTNDTSRSAKGLPSSAAATTAAPLGVPAPFELPEMFTTKLKVIARPDRPFIVPYAPYTGGQLHAMLHSQCNLHWNNFYRNNRRNAYKDRHYIMREFTPLAAAVARAMGLTAAAVPAVVTNEGSVVDSATAATLASATEDHGKDASGEVLFQMLSAASVDVRRVRVARSEGAVIKAAGTAVATDANVASAGSGRRRSRSPVTADETATTHVTAPSAKENEEDGATDASASAGLPFRDVRSLPAPVLLYELGCGVGNLCLPTLEALLALPTNHSSSASRQMDRKFEAPLRVVALDFAPFAIQLLRDDITHRGWQGLVHADVHDITQPFLPAAALTADLKFNRSHTPEASDAATGVTTFTRSSPPTAAPAAASGVHATLAFVLCSVPPERHAAAISNIAALLFDSWCHLCARRGSGEMNVAAIASTPPTLWFRDYAASDLAMQRFAARGAHAHVQGAAAAGCADGADGPNAANADAAGDSETAAATFMRTNGTLSHFFTEAEVNRLFAACCVRVSLPPAVASLFATATIAEVAEGAKTCKTTAVLRFRTVAAPRILEQVSVNRADGAVRERRFVQSTLALHVTLE